MAATSVVLSTFAALADAEDEVANGFLLAAIYTLAIRSDTSPRDVLDSMFKALPTDALWPPMRDALLGMGEAPAA